MAAEGLKFTQYYAPSPFCAPTRDSVLTGRYVAHATVREFGDTDPGLKDEDVTIAEILKEAGYTNGVFGKWGIGYVGTSGHPLNQGFDEFFGYLDHVHAHFYYPRYLIHNYTEVYYPMNNGTHPWESDEAVYAHDEIHKMGSFSSLFLTILDF